MALEQRPRERVKANGVEVLSDPELLAIILQNGSQGENVIDLSHRLINTFGLDKLNSLSLQELMKIKGIKLAKASKLIAAFELSKRVNSGKICEKIVSNAADIASHYMEKLKDLKKEHFIAVFLDTKNKIICDKVISIGTLNSSLVHPREVFKEAIKVSANAIILVHNHPSGDCEASDEDRRITKILMGAGEMVGIKILDHIIIGEGKKYESIC
ncbi:DNA repair protein RadC [Candidatus Woesearchaeota archaeon]|nr:DNA repair protein RadC [Candidatus Woesearchaeota archaeon]